LARWQADWVADRLRQLGRTVEIVEIATHGDAEPIAPIIDIGSPGVFTKAIQRALVAGEIDLAVHSLKDLPTEVVPGLTLGAVPPRESPADVLVGRPSCDTPGPTCASRPSAATSRHGCGSLTMTWRAADSTPSCWPRPD
jgi:hydroxymethylbilane synthase